MLLLGRTRLAFSQCRTIHTSISPSAEMDWSIWLSKDRHRRLKKLRSQSHDYWKSEVLSEHRPPVEYPVETVTFIPPVEEDEVARRVSLDIPELRVRTAVPAIPKLDQLPQVPKPMYPALDPYTGTVTGHGSRKTAIAAVAIIPNGTGKITINGVNWMDYFPSLYVRSVMLEPIIATEKFNDVDIRITTKGGGFMGQAQAIKNGLARALVRGDPEYRFLMRTSRMMRYDGRIKERKHTGRRKARKRQAWVKR